MKQGQGAGNWDVKPQRSQDDRSDVAIGGDARQAKTNFERMLKNDLGQVQIAKQFALTVDGKLLEAQKPETVNLPLAADLMPLAEKLLADAKQLDIMGGVVRKAAQSQDYITGERELASGLDLARSMLARKEQFNQILARHSQAQDPPLAGSGPTPMSDDERAYLSTLAVMSDEIDAIESLHSSNAAVQRTHGHFSAAIGESRKKAGDGDFIGAQESLYQAAELIGTVRTLEAAWASHRDSSSKLEPLMRQLAATKLKDGESQQRTAAQKAFAEASSFAEHGNFQKASESLDAAEKLAATLLPEEGRAGREFEANWGEVEPRIKSAVALPGATTFITDRKQRLRQALDSIPKLAEAGDYVVAQQGIDAAEKDVAAVVSASFNWQQYARESAALNPMIEGALNIVVASEPQQKLKQAIPDLVTRAETAIDQGRYLPAVNTLRSAHEAARRLIGAVGGPDASAVFDDLKRSQSMFDAALNIQPACKPVETAVGEFKQAKEALDRLMTQGPWDQAKTAMTSCKLRATETLEAHADYQAVERIRESYDGVFTAALQADDTLPGAVDLKAKLTAQIDAANDAVDVDLKQALAGFRGAYQLANQINAIVERQQKQGERKKALDDTVGRAAKTYLPPGMSDVLAKNSTRGEDAKWDAVLAAMKAAETDRADDRLDQLAAAAREWLAAYGSLDPQLKADSKIDARRQTCETALLQARHLALANKARQLGSPPWSQTQEDQAADIYMQVIFESGDMPMTSAGASAFGAKWISSKDFESGKAERKFVFKSADSTSPDLEQTQIPGFAPGSEPVREVLGDELNRQLKAMTGLEFNVPETRIVGVQGSKLGDGADPGQVFLGSAQAAAPTVGNVQDTMLDHPEILQGVTPKAVQKMALFDALGMNMDRHKGNFLVTPPGEGGSELVPIDNGLAFPTREGLESRRGRMAGLSAFNSIPSSSQPFDPEILAAIDMIDVEEIIAGLKARTQSLGAQQPTLNVAGVPDSAIELIRRNMKFLKAAAPNVSPATLMDLIMENAVEIFDTPDDRCDEAIAAVVEKGRRREQANGPYVSLPPQEQLAMCQTLYGLGWNDVFGEPTSILSNGFSNWDLWFRRNPVEALKLFSSKKANPAATEQLAKLLAEVKRIQPNSDIDQRVAGRSLREAIYTANSRLLTLAGPAERKELALDFQSTFPNERLPTDEGELKGLLDAYKQFVKWGGKGIRQVDGRRIDSLPFSKRWEAVKRVAGPEQEQAMVAELKLSKPFVEMVAEFRRYTDDVIDDVSSLDKVKQMLNDWERLKRLGGIKAFIDAGGDCEKLRNGPANPANWLKAIFDAKTAEVDA